MRLNPPWCTLAQPPLANPTAGMVRPCGVASQLFLASQLSRSLSTLCLSPTNLKRVLLQVQYLTFKMDIPRTNGGPSDRRDSVARKLRCFRGSTQDQHDAFTREQDGVCLALVREEASGGVFCFAPLNIFFMGTILNHDGWTQMPTILQGGSVPSSSNNKSAPLFPMEPHWRFGTCVPHAPVISAGIFCETWRLFLGNVKSLVNVP